MNDAVPTKETPDEVLARLCDGADPRRVRSLRAIHAVCEAQREHGSRDYSLATIGRLARTTGGPSAAALGNPTGKAYRLLIASHRDAYAAAPRQRKRQSDDVDALLVGIRDPLQRARIEQLRDEVRRLRVRAADLQRLANGAARVTVVRGEANEPDRVLQDVRAPDLLPYEREALVRALEPRRLKALGLTAGPTGRVETEDGHELFAAGFATGLRKLLLALASPQPARAHPVAFGGSEIGGPTETTL